MAKVVVPVGFDMGSVFAETGPADRDPLRYEIHLGCEPQELTAQQYSAWRTAFDDPQRHAELAVDRASLERRLGSDPDGPSGPLTDPEPIVQDLIDRRLLLEYDTDDIREDVFGQLRLFPRAFGMGNTRAAPDRYQIGYPGHLFARVGPMVYQLWSIGATYPALWTAFEEISAAPNWDVAPGESKPGPEDVGNMVGVALPLLVSSGAAFVDLLNFRQSGPTPTTVDRGAVPEQGKSAVLLPVGLSMGEEYSTSGSSGQPDTSWLVRHGLEWVELSPEEREVYLTILTERDRADQWRLSRRNLAKAVRAGGGSEHPERVIDGLLDRGLMVELDPANGPLEQLFRRLQLFPLGRGLGNTPDHPERYRIGIGDAPQMWASAEAYWIWAYSLTSGSLWDACAHLAEGIDENLQPGEEPLNYTADELARMVAHVLPTLVSHGCGYLDPLNYAR